MPTDILALYLDDYITLLDWIDRAQGGELRIYTLEYCCRYASN
jgi:hypothetical protein